METPRSPLHSQRNRFQELCVLGVLAFGASQVMALCVFQWQTVTGDEGSYLFQANCFLDGVLKRDCPVFHPLLSYDMIILRPDAGWVSRYPPGHGLWLVPGVWIGFPHVMSSLAAAITVMCSYEVGCRLRFPRFLLPVLLLISPFFLFMHGTLLSHTSGLAAVSVMFLAYLSWRQALLIAIPFGLDCLYQIHRDRRNIALWLGSTLFAGGAAVGIGVYMAYNAAVTGDAGLPTYLYYEASEGLGFGARRTQGGAGFRIEHTFLRGVTYLWNNIRLMDSWMLGVPFSLVAWLALVVHGWSRRWSLVLLGACLMVCAGYVYFWYPGITDVGPVYYTELLLFVMVLAGFGLSRMWRKGEATPRRRAASFFVMGILLFIASIGFSLNEADRLRVQLADRVAFAETLRELPEQAIVFRQPIRDRYLDHFIGLNEAGLDSDPLILRSRSDNDALIAAHFPERSAWTLSYSNEHFVVTPLEQTGTPLKVDAVRTHRDRNVGENQDDRRVVKSDAQAGLLVYGWYTYLAAGDYELHFDMRWSGVEGETPVTIELAIDQGKTVACSAELSEGLSSTTLRFHLEQLAEVEPRIHYGGSGTVSVKSLELVPVADGISPVNEEPLL